MILRIRSSKKDGSWEAQFLFGCVRWIFSSEEHWSPTAAFPSVRVLLESFLFIQVISFHETLQNLMTSHPQPNLIEVIQWVKKLLIPFIKKELTYIYIYKMLSMLISVFFFLENRPENTPCCQSWESLSHMSFCTGILRFCIRYVDLSSITYRG